MSGDTPTADVDRLLGKLDESLSSLLRAVVEYTPQSSTIHYLSDDIDETEAEARLVRISELYHSERLSVAPFADDPDFGPLYASVHLFNKALVVHLIEPSGVVYGLSFDPSVAAELVSVVRASVQALYGEIPEFFDVPIPETGE